jgi:hypothetical protein
MSTTEKTALFCCGARLEDNDKYGCPNCCGENVATRQPIEKEDEK